MLILSAITLLYGTIAGALSFLLRRLMGQAEHFSATLDQFRKDRDFLEMESSRKQFLIAASELGRLRLIEDFSSLSEGYHRLSLKSQSSRSSNVRVAPLFSVGAFFLALRAKVDTLGEDAD